MKLKKRYSLLYVEDEVLIRKAAVSFLEDQFSEIYEASDGVEAYLLYKQKHPDIIITDIQMPRMNGLQFCEKIRKEDDRTPVIILTAYSHKEYLLKATELNLVKYLIKPIQENALLEAISRAIEKIDTGSKSVIDVGDGYFYDGFNHLLTNGTDVMHLPALQSKLLAILIQNKGRVVSYQQLENEIYEDSAMSKDAIRSLVRDIRKVSYKGIIENISKVGYRVNLDG